MLRKSLTMAVILGATALSSAAFAQDESGFNRDEHFNGLYVTGFGGVAAQPSDQGDVTVFDTNGDGEFTDTVRTASGANAFTGFCNGRATSNVPGTGCSNDKDRVEYGGRIGYDMRMGNIVVGALLEGSGNDILDGTTGYSSTPAFYELQRGIDYNISARARLGYTPGGGALFYATGGVSTAKINHSFRTSNTANTFTEVDGDKMVWGYQVGGGAEVMLTNNLSLGVEYLFNRYNDDKYYVQVSGGGATNPFVVSGGNVRIQPSSENFTYQSFRGTLSYRF